MTDVLSQRPQDGASAPHISVCVCTYKRAELLRQLLDKVAAQKTNGAFTYSIVVADNDPLESARSVVDEFAARSTVKVAYRVQPEQNIALTRNLAIATATGDFVAFIDDDEFPVDTWLLALWTTWCRHDVDGVLGPVLPYFDETAPTWLAKTGIFDRPRYPTGTALGWRATRTGNVLLSRRLFKDGEEPFRREFRTGEDQDFFRRMIEQGRSFIWCDEAVVFEVVPPNRCKRSYMLRRALMRGCFSLRHPGRRLSGAVESLIAAPAYLAMLPGALLLGHSRFMTCLFKLTYHVGRLLAVVGIQPIRDAYVTD